MSPYETILELRDAITSGQVSPENVQGFIDGGELFLYCVNPGAPEQAGVLVFASYYGGRNACDDICALLGIPAPEDV